MTSTEIDCAIQRNSVIPVVAIVGTILFFTGAPADAENQGQKNPQSQSPSQPSAGRSSNDHLKFINNPGGGQIVYGPLADQSTMQGAMGEMLRSVHGHFGERPQIGNFFQAKGSNSVATFFSTHSKKEGGGTIPIYGMVIVSMNQGSRPIGAVLYDDSAHFAKSQPVMMKTLNEAWGAASVRGPSAEGSPSRQSAGPITLRQATGGDRSASIGLPPGWHITTVAGGYLSALGPDGEMMDISSMFQQIHDPRAGQQGMGYVGAFRQNGPTLVAPLQGDLFTSYASLVNQVRQSRGKPPASFHLVSSQKVGQQAVQAVFEVDLHDGKGPRRGNVRLDPVYTRGVPTWGLMFTSTNAPVSVYPVQSQVMNAMYKTYSQNRAIINGEQQTVLNGIAAAGERSRIQAAAADQRRENSSAAFNAHMDDISANSKAMQNYTLDRSTLSYRGEDGHQYHGTFENPTADALVAHDPTRFTIIQSQQFIKGVDY
jgi:hypothetical protein